MPIVHNNHLFKGGVKGTLGKNVVYKYYRKRDMVVMANYPRKRKTHSEKQLAQQDRFWLATDYAKNATDIPHIKAIYQKGVNPRRTSAYAIALDDYLHAPVIGEINLLTYTGAPGELIRVRAFDDFKVMSVSIRISKADGTLIEQGQAQPRGKKGLWRMVTTVRNEHVAGTIFTIVAKDMAENKTQKIVQISIAGQANALTDGTGKASDKTVMNQLVELKKREPNLSDEKVTHATLSDNADRINAAEFTNRLNADIGDNEISVKHSPSGDDIADNAHAPGRHHSHKDNTTDQTSGKDTLHKTQTPGRQPTSDKVDIPHINETPAKDHLPDVHQTSDDVSNNASDRSHPLVDIRWFADGGFLRGT